MKTKYMKNHLLILLAILILLFILREIYFRRRKHEVDNFERIEQIGEHNPNQIIFRENFSSFIVKDRVLPAWVNTVFMLQANSIFSKEHYDSASHFIKNKGAINSYILLIGKFTKLFHYSVLTSKDIFIEMKMSLLKKSKKSLNLSHFSLVEGMVFGDISTMDDSFKHKLKVIGMLHVVSASGYNISLLLVLSGAIFRKLFSKKVLFIWSIFLIYAYALMVG